MIPHPDDASTLTTKIDHASGSFDCLSFAAMYVSTKVKDDDGDGLLNKWETAVSDGGGFRDPATSNVLVDLASMGANPNHKDLFVEADYMQEFLEVEDYLKILCSQIEIQLNRGPTVHFSVRIGSSRPDWRILPYGVCVTVSVRIKTVSYLELCINNRKSELS